MARELMRRLRSWEGLLLVVLLVILAYNITRVPNYLTISNQVNLFQPPRGPSSRQQTGRSRR